MLDRLIEGIGAGSYWGVALLMFLENVFPPIPSEVIMPLAGSGAAKGKMTLWGVIVAGTIGSWLGQLPLYYLGKVMGEKCIKQWAATHPWLAVSPEELDHANGWFDRHGKKAVFFGRLVPSVRSLISIPAGITRMPLTPFLIYTGLGTALWTSLLAYGGKALGENYGRLQHYLNPASWIVIAAIVGFYIWRVAKRWNEMKQSEAQTS